MITTILAIYLLKEKVGLRKWIAIFLEFFGIVIILRPGTSLFNLYMLLPLFGGTALSLTIISLKAVLKFDKPPTCSFYMHFLVILIMAGTLFFNFTSPSYKQFFLLFCMGFIGCIVQILATNAYKISDVSILSPIDYSSIIWAITFGIIFFADYPDLYVIFGSLIIVISTYYIIYRERKLGQKINLNKINTRQI